MIFSFAEKSEVWGQFLSVLRRKFRYRIRELMTEKFSGEVVYTRMALREAERAAEAGEVLRTF